MSDFRLVSHSDLAGCGDGMQVVREQDALYVGHFGISGAGTSILDVSDPAAPRLVEQWAAPAGTHTHKVQVADGLLLVNQERFRTSSDWTAGLVVYDVSSPLAPQAIGRFDCGGAGVHRIVWRGGRYAHASATPEGYADRIWLVIDLLDPERPVEAARFVLDEPQPEGRRYAAHHALVADDVAYLGYGDANLVVLDLADPSAPVQIGRLSWDGGNTHTCLPLPGRGLLVTTDEQVVDGLDAPPRRLRVVDVGDPRQPAVLAVCPESAVRRGPLRFGPHNLHENNAGSWQSEQVVFATYFSGGLVVYDLGVPREPRLLTSWLPASLERPQLNDLYVQADALVWVTDRVGGGLFAVEPDEGLRELLEDRAGPAGPAA
jgi:hypothetical protein